MPSELTRDQINELEQALEQRREELLEETRQQLLRSDNEQYIQLAGRVHDVVEASVADLLVDLNLADIDRDIREIRDIEQALIRIKTGTYGICVDTGEPIDYERLKVYPTAMRSRLAQEQFEKSNMQKEPPTL